MGRKSRRGRRNSDDESPQENEIQVQNKKDGDADGENTKKSGWKDLDFSERRELQRQQAAEKRKAKQKCYLCGKAGHVRRQCPGIADDGRGMSRYKGKSDPASERQKLQQRRQHQQNHSKGRGDSSPNVTSLDIPEEFSRKSGRPEEALPYVDVSCDIQATIDYLRSGRGKSKLSQKEAVTEYQNAIRKAAESSNIQAIISKSFLSKPNRPWIPPVDVMLPGLDLYYVVGLASSTWPCSTVTEREQAVNALEGALLEHKDKIVGCFATLDYRGTTLDLHVSMDPELQINRLHCAVQAAGRRKLPLQIQVLPGASNLDPENKSVAGTDYAKALLGLQQCLTKAIADFPEIQFHLVSWSGRADHMISLLKAFPENLRAIGLDGSVTFHKASHLHECAFEVPLGRLVLETSKVIPSKVANSLGRTAFFQSGWLPFVAEAVAHYKKTASLSDIALAAHLNSLDLYPSIQAGEEQEDDIAVKSFFVYGTLRETGNNRHIVKDYIKTCAQGCSIQGTLFYYSQEEGGKGNFPYATEEADSDSRIVGELLTVSDWEASLEALDKLECCPTFYYRKIQSVRLPCGGYAKAWVYFMQASMACQGARIPSGDWIEETQSCLDQP